MTAEIEQGFVSWPEFYDEMLLQFGPDELDDPMAALTNLKQTGSMSGYHRVFIKLAHLADDTEKNLISLFMSELKEDLRGKVKINRPLTMVVAYRSASAQEMISHTEKRINRFQSYKNSGSPAGESPLQVKSLATPTAGKKGGSVNSTHQ